MYSNIVFIKLILGMYYVTTSTICDTECYETF